MMARLFERFVLNFYRREQSAYKANPTKIYWNDVEADHGDLQFLPDMNTDVTLQSTFRTIVIDTKYYASSLQTSQFGKTTVHSGNLYQLFAYLRNVEKVTSVGHAVEGILLYPVVDQSFDLRYRIHGHPFRVTTVDLNQPWPTIKNRLLSLID